MLCGRWAACVQKSQISLDTLHSHPFQSNLEGTLVCNLMLVDPLTSLFSDIVDIKPANMEDLTEVITSAEFHPHHCHLFVYSSSKGTLRLCDMRASALCDRHTKCEFPVKLETWSSLLIYTADKNTRHLLSLGSV